MAKRNNKPQRSVIGGEWSRLLHNTVLMISMIVIMFIPIMYGGFFLGSIWDPYGKTGAMPVAFVNEDEGASLNEKHIAIGQDIATSLKENRDIGWEFVSREAANNGVNDGYYYAVITVPKDFSRNVASVAEAQPKQAVLHYTVTPSKNYIGALVSNQAADKVRSTVSRQITKAYAEGILKAIDTVGEGLAAASTGAEQLSGGASQLSSGVVRYTSGVQQLANHQQALQGGLGELRNGSQQLQQGLRQLHQGLPTEQQISQLTTGLAQLQSGIATLNTQVSQPSPDMVRQQQAVLAAAELLQQSLKSLQGAQHEYTKILTDASRQATQHGEAKLRPQDIKQLVAFGAQTKEVADQSVSLMAALQSLNTTVAQQQRQLQTGVNQLHHASTALLPPTTTAITGFTKVRGANEQLLGGSIGLYNGLVRAEQGGGQLVAGVGQLTAASSQLVVGSQRLSDGSATLADKLHHASQRIMLQPTAAETQQHIAEPVTVHEEARGEVPNYGYALSPYVLSLGLFVGGLVFNVIYPIRTIYDKTASFWKQWLAKASVAGVAAVVQATILIAIMTNILGLHPDNMAQFMGATYLTSLAYMAIVTTLAVTLDNPGRFLAMVLLVLQLGASEGTFPIQTAPHFFQAINPFLPMTYSIHALRQSISGGMSEAVYIRGIGMLSLFLVVAISAWLLYLYMRARSSRQD